MMGIRNDGKVVNRSYGRGCKINDAIERNNRPSFKMNIQNFEIKATVILSKHRDGASRTPY